LVPAHNEQDIIEATISSLMAQTYPFTYVLIIADNCTDNTVRIVKRLQRRYGTQKLRLLKTVGNTHKKAGALNQGFEAVRSSRPNYIFGMDADTIIDSKMVEEAVRQFKVEPNTAGICSAYRTLPLKKETTRWQRFLWRLQNIEFGLANAWRIENYESARVLPGVSVMFRAKALSDVYKLHKGTVWATDSLVEDYRLTLERRSHGQMCH
jgi:biofilm PGA synthesis N-glycosyltransferase PgaC